MSRENIEKLVENVELSWNNVFLHLERNSISDLYEQPRMTHDQLVNDLLLFQELFPTDASILKNDFLEEGLNELFEGPKFGGKSPNGFRISLVHVIAQMLRSIETIDGYKRFKKQFKSHRGMLNQLYATCYLNKHLTITGIEQKVGKQDVDVVCELDGETLLFHVKTIDQFEKSQMVMQCFHKLHSHLSIERGGRDKILGIKLFDGVVPLDIKDGELQSVLKEIPYEPGTYKLDFGKGYSAIVELDWTTTGKIRGPNSFRNFSNHLEKAEDSINDDSENRNILIGVLGSMTLVKDINVKDNATFKNRKIDAEFFIHVSCGFDYYHIERTEVFSKEMTHDFAQKLGGSLAKEYKLTS